MKTTAYGEKVFTPNTDYLRSCERTKSKRSRLVGAALLTAVGIGLVVNGAIQKNLIGSEQDINTEALSALNGRTEITQTYEFREYDGVLTIAKDSNLRNTPEVVEEYDYSNKVGNTKKVEKVVNPLIVEDQKNPSNGEWVGIREVEDGEERMFWVNTQNIKDFDESKVTAFDGQAEALIAQDN